MSVKLIGRGGLLAVVLGLLLAIAGPSPGRAAAVKLDPSLPAASAAINGEVQQQARWRRHWGWRRHGWRRHYGWRRHHWRRQWGWRRPHYRRVFYVRRYWRPRYRYYRRW